MVKRVVPVAAFIHRIDNYIYLVRLPYSTSVKIPVAHYSFYTPCLPELNTSEKGLPDSSLLKIDFGTKLTVSFNNFFVYPFMLLNFSHEFCGFCIARI